MPPDLEIGVHRLRTGILEIEKLRLGVKWFCALVLVLTCIACAPSPSPSAPSAPSQTSASSNAPGTLTVTSTAFAEGGDIPVKFTCNGQSVSPELKWSGGPTTTQSFALIVDDPDAPIGTFTHWVAYDIPANTTELGEGAQNIGKSGNNGAGRTGFIGPCPPSGTHRYLFQVYALDTAALNLKDGATRDDLRNAMQGHILAQGTLTGRYGK